LSSEWSNKSKRSNDRHNGKKRGGLFRHDDGYTCPLFSHRRGFGTDVA
jgi:hypothetical protein